MNGKQLKNSILQWAIQGKLVQQDPNDEPASVLLEHIREEKAKLVKEKKIKKDKNESIIYRGDDNSYYEKFIATGEVKCIDEEIPFEIPNGWEWCRLRQITSLLGDGIHGTPEYDPNGEYYFVNGNNLQDKKIVIKPDTKKVSREEYLKYKKNLNKHTVLVSINGTLGNIGFYNDEPIMLGKSACYFNLIVEDLKEYVYILLQSPFFMEYTLKAATGTTIKNVSLMAMNNLLIPLPPLCEQNRIVDRMTILDTKVKQYQKQETCLRELNNNIYSILKKSILQDAIQGKLVPQIAEEGTAEELLAEIHKEKERLVKEGKLKKSALTDSIIFKGDDNKYYERIGKSEVDISDEISFEIPSTWIWSRLKNVVALNPRNCLDDEFEVGFIPMTYIKAGYLSHFEYSRKKWKEVKAGFTHLADGDVAFAKITPCFQNRKSMIIKSVINGYAAGTTELNVLRPYSETIAPEYLLWFCKSSYFIDEVKMKGTAGQQRVTVDYTPNKLIPLPPKDEQKRIVARIKELLDTLQ
ncbi:MULTISPECIES: restriction endonuclease subunit S [Bacteroides]|uniref:Restriction endonuclease subunit S n=2 Tax=Bacteroides fragilis TaxID=817 RepID=A0AAE6C1A5_BACFG|nr:MULTISPECIES: restriction endonuclease subunit S [Bacteroides]MCE8630315.1 restriction endonuclease subunit S [Bacteroides fragilis]MCE8675724.1 restriction endonuclease subunit S [Bacteroides fragilis]MDK2380338.1 restriction endonuclease subunit S [Bacteroides fragilis]QCQ45426.1 restriction endonuclease subunit S [Bacteroides fragilis]QLK82819.1 restriction endonuclease subunit S [Bacteroides sp. PHL 2737]